MSLNLIMNSATSGLNTAQKQLRLISDNVANVNTPGYVRKIGDQASLHSQGVGTGVEVARIRLATDRFLQAASLNAGADASRQGVRYELYERISSLFGDPGGNSGFFTQIDSLFSTFAASAEDPLSGPRRQEAIYKTQAAFEESARIARQIQATREDADGRIQSAVEKANALIQQIEALNKEIARATVSGGDPTGAQGAQAPLIDQLAELMDIRVSERSVGGVTIRTSGGLMLAGDGHATLSYNRAGAVTSETAFNEIMITEPHGVQPRPLAEQLTSGEIRGLLDVRDVEAPAAAERLGELMTRLADELNRAHNASSSVPAPASLTGRNVGQSLETALTGFNGRTTIAVLNDQGVIQTSVEVVFSGGTMTVGGVATDPTTFLATLNAQLGGQATASFNNGVLSFQASAGNGVAIADDQADPSLKAGRGFSHYFGLNDLISTDRPAIYDIGMTSASQHGFTQGQTLTLRMQDANGARVRDVTFAVPAGAATMDDLLAALNDPATGAGRYGSFAFQNGEVKFTPNGQPATRMTVLDDRTVQVPSGVSMSELFGLGGVRASRADGFSIRSDIQNNPSKLSLARLDLTAAPGAAALTKGDGRGARLLAEANERTAVFAAAGGAAGGSMSISRYASEMSGDIGGKAAAAKSRAESAQALQGEIASRRMAKEGVNLDEELVLMTTYQQSYNASARLIQAAKDMYDVLIGMV